MSINFPDRGRWSNNKGWGSGSRSPSPNQIVPPVKTKTPKKVTPSNGMNADLQKQFMYLFERVNEPLFYGPRGRENVYYNCPKSGLSDMQQKASTMIRESMPGKGGGTVTVATPRVMPDLSKIAAACPKSKIFSYFLPSHREAAGELTNVLMTPSENDYEQFLATSVACRDSPMINSQLWVHAMYSAALSRKDMRSVLKLPPLWEVMPDLFINGLTRKIAQQQSSLPDGTRSVIMVNHPPEIAGSAPMTTEVTLDSNFTGRGDNPESKLWYFREDIGIASHHWHWHIIYSGNNPPNKRDRKGELFYYMHHGMVARYEAERLCNGLARTRPLDVSAGPIIEEGYFSKLSSENSGRNWGTRQEFTQLRDVFRQEDNLVVDIEDMRKWKDRILEAIDSGFIIGRDGNRIQLHANNGVDILGGLIENGGMSSMNPNFYGNLHNMGHVIIAASHDPEHRHRENMGPMGAEATAIRDPVFFRWHKFIDNLFDKFKNTLDPYPATELQWSAVQNVSIEVRTEGAGQNVLSTHWGQTDVDLSRGLDLARSNMNQGPVWARFTHLNHLPFTYTINVNFRGGAPSVGTFRIFMAPRFNEHGQRFPMTQQRLLFFEMDKFTHRFTPGQNTVTRRSTESSVTIPWEQSFRDLERAMADEMNAVSAVCGCGWPHHLLIPKGTPDGTVFDLYVMVTDGALDHVQQKDGSPTQGQTQGCKESLSFCGILDKFYPDKRPMGFPFDRKPPPVSAPKGGRPAPTGSLDDFIANNSNMGTVQVKVIHQNRVVVRPGGAEEKPTTSVIVPSRATSSKGRWSSQSRSPSPARASRSFFRSGSDSSPDRF